MVDSNSEMMAEGDSGFCTSVSSHRIFEPIVGDPSLTDMQLSSCQILAQSQWRLSQRASPPVSDAPASTASAEQNLGGVLSEQLELAEPFVPDVLEPTTFRAPLLSGPGSGENWRRDRSNEVSSPLGNVILGEPPGTPSHLQDNISDVGGAGYDASQPNCVDSFDGLKPRSADVCARCMYATKPTVQKQPSGNAFVCRESPIGAAADSMGPSYGAPYLGVHSSLSNISGPPGVRPLFAFPVSEARDEPNVIPDHMRALLFRGADAGEVESARPKRRNIRISKDPQSVAARHRRERISDRIRVLQRLVPGGTKMDTASMLDEAVHYVKFLKLQLQALEQLGNSFDPNFTMGMPAFQPISHPAVALRPFDLNCSAYQAAAASPSANASHSSSPTGSHITGYPRSSSSMCFPDHPQEQFCH